jgi:hypothetical protein
MTIVINLKDWACTFENDFPAVSLLIPNLTWVEQLVSLQGVPSAASVFMHR